MASRAPSRVLLAASVGLYLASLTQNVFCLRSGSGLNCSNAGWAVLAIGWMGLITIGEVGPFVTLPWLANPCLLLAWIFLLVSLRRPAVALAVVGLLLGAAFLLGTSLQMSEGGGPPSEIVTRGAGYWLWLGSLGAAFLGALSVPGTRDKGHGR
jgi:hypothetical protein